MRTITWEGGAVKMIDQTALPLRLSYISCVSPAEVATAVRTMVVRGAPAIGVAAAMGVALAATRSHAGTKEELMRDMRSAAELIRATRPTAVNLFWGVERVLSKAEAAQSVPQAKESVVSEVKHMEDEDVKVNRQLGKVGADLIDNGDTVLTQCNAGALATVGYGTALGVLRAAKEQGKFVKVLVPETRPALQGSRLTAFELTTDGIDCAVIADTAVGFMMNRGRVDKVIVGADRITRDGFVFNKIGTYQEAVLAKRHRIPFFVAAPSSTFDLNHVHTGIVIEERGFDEVVKIRGRRIAPKGVPVSNPAFDVTPPTLIAAVITERGLISQPIAASIGLILS
jgi:methylthioribose-1-phosphate isomerase